jgi:hypothetical protein
MDTLRGACIQVKVARFRNRDTKKYSMSLVPQTVLKFVGCNKNTVFVNFLDTEAVQVDKLL